MKLTGTILLGLFGSVAFWEPSAPDQDQAGSDPAKEPRWLVSGRVVEAGTGQPLSGVRAGVLLRRVPWLGMIASGDSLKTDGEGRFRVSAAFPDVYVVHATEVELPNRPVEGRGGARPRLGQFFRPLSVSGAPGETTECTVVLGPAATVHLAVTDPEGKPVSGASIVAVSEEAPHPVQLMDCARTDEKGSVEFLGLGEGSWRLLLFKRGVGVGTADLPALKWGEKRDIAVRLGPSGDLYVACRVHGTEGEGDLDDLTAVMCEVYGADGKLVSAGPLIPPQWGYANVEEMPTSKEEKTLLYAGSYAPGRYRVVVRSPRIGT
ncbi:MAG: carboxypeptidase-like regulatory domain-containing protein, partial [Planctomycetes bacterium]|nr:carboxypeptidase-like regulatory domain-containing protein [Planctomycetota bacterium]